RRPHRHAADDECRSGRSASLAGIPGRHATGQNKFPARVDRHEGQNHLGRCGEAISIRRSQGEGTTGGECRGPVPEILLEVRGAGKIDGRLRHPGKGGEREVLFPMKRRASSRNSTSSDPLTALVWPAWGRPFSCPLPDSLLGSSRYANTFTKYSTWNCWGA